MSKPGAGTYYCSHGQKTFIFFLTSVPAGYDIDIYDAGGGRVETPVRVEIYRAFPPFHHDDVFSGNYHFVSVLDPGLTLYLTPLKTDIAAVIT